MREDEAKGGHRRIDAAADVTLTIGSPRHLSIAQEGVGAKLLLPDARGYLRPGGVMFTVVNLGPEVFSVYGVDANGSPAGFLGEVPVDTTAKLYLLWTNHPYTGWRMVAPAPGTFRLTPCPEDGPATKHTLVDLAAYVGAFVRLEDDYDHCWLVEDEDGAKIETVVVDASTPVDGYATCEECERGWLVLCLIDDSGSMDGSASTPYGVNDGSNANDYRIAALACKVLGTVLTGNTTISISGGAGDRPMNPKVKLCLSRVGLNNPGGIGNATYEVDFDWQSGWLGGTTLGANFYNDLHLLDDNSLQTDLDPTDVFLTKMMDEINSEDDGDVFVKERSLCVYCTDAGAPAASVLTNQIDAATFNANRVRLFVVCTDRNSTNVNLWAAALTAAGYDPALWHVATFFESTADSLNSGSLPSAVLEVSQWMAELPPIPGP